MTRMTAAEYREACPARPRVDREGPVHFAVLEFLRLALPGAVIHHSPNETDMRGPAAARMIAKQKRMGMLPGFPDFIVFWRGRTWGFEVKAEHGRLSQGQRDVGAAMQAQGAKWAVVRSVDDVRACVLSWIGHGPDRAFLGVV